MLLCILEEDVGYRPTIKAIRPGQDLRLLICEESRAATATFRWFCGIGQQGQLGQARQRCDVVYIWYVKTDSLIFFIGVLGFRSWLSARRNSTQSGSGFQSRGKGHLIFNWEIPCCVLIDRRLRGRDQSRCTVKERPLYPWTMYYVTVLFQVSAILFSARV